MMEHEGRWTLIGLVTWDQLKKGWLSRRWCCFRWARVTRAQREASRESTIGSREQVTGSAKASTSERGSKTGESDDYNQWPSSSLLPVKLSVKMESCELSWGFLLHPIWLLPLHLLIWCRGVSLSTRLDRIPISARFIYSSSLSFLFSAFRQSAPSPPSVF